MKFEQNLQNKTTLAIVTVGLLLAGFQEARAQMVNYCVGIDGRLTLPSGTYAGLPNPNAGRLTFLYAHSYAYVPGHQPAGQSAFNNNHYHAISAYSYTGPAGSPTVLNTNANSRIPETSTGQPPLTLVPGTGLYADKLVSAKTAEHYSDQRIHSVWKFNDPAKSGAGSPEYIMFHSSGGTRTNSLAGSLVELELVSKSADLHVGSADQLDILVNPGDRHPLGDGNAVEFLPVFWVDATAAAGHYTVALKLVDTDTAEGRTPFPESGIFHLDFQVATEPTLAIERAVNLTLPLVTPGYVLESAPSLDGPWTPVNLGGSVPAGNQQTLSLPAANALQVFRLKKQ